MVILQINILGLGHSVELAAAPAAAGAGCRSSAGEAPRARRELPAAGRGDLLILLLSFCCSGAGFQRGRIVTNSHSLMRLSGTARLAIILGARLSMSRQGVRLGGFGTGCSGHGLVYEILNIFLPVSNHAPVN
jgi:hypothetical protein